MEGSLAVKWNAMEWNIRLWTSLEMTLYGMQCNGKAMLLCSGKEMNKQYGISRDENGFGTGMM
jgi:hypothetical protein